MKKIYLGLIVAFVALFTSCQFTENIYINEDGTGKVSFKMDGSELMDMMGDEMANGDDKEEAIDSIMSFKDMFDAERDSISQLSKAEQAKLKKLEPFKMHMVMNVAEKKMNFDIFADFKNVNELQDMFAAMNTAGSMDKSSDSKAEANPMSALGSDDVTTTSYSFKNNVFKRSVDIIDQTKIDSIQQNLGQAKMMFAASNYTLKYHFPRKIKSVSLENATISEDGKSFTAEINFMEYLANPKSLDVKVELEN